MKSKSTPNPKVQEGWFGFLNSSLQIKSFEGKKPNQTKYT